MLLVGVAFVLFAALSLSSPQSTVPAPAPASPSPASSGVPVEEPTASPEPEVTLIPVTLPTGMSIPVPSTWKTSAASGADLAFTLRAEPTATPTEPADRVTEAPAQTPPPIVTVTDLGPLASVYDQDVLDIVGETLAVSGRDAATPVIDDRGVATFTQTGTFTVEARVLVYAGRGLLITLTLAKLDTAVSAEVADWVTELTAL
jgi:hypothetical protein